MPSPMDPLSFVYKVFAQPPHPTQLCAYTCSYYHTPWSLVCGVFHTVRPSRCFFFFLRTVLSSGYWKLCLDEVPEN